LAFPTASSQSGTPNGFRWFIVLLLLMGYNNIIMI